MTDNQKAHVEFYNWQFETKFKDKNPYILGAKVWEWWYFTHTIDSKEAIPRDLLPTDEQYKEWDCKQVEYVASHLKSYTDLLSYWAETKRKDLKDTIAGVVARTRPCGCVEAQCNLFCPYYRTESCQ